VACFGTKPFYFTQGHFPIYIMKCPKTIIYIMLTKLKLIFLLVLAVCALNVQGQYNSDVPAYPNVLNSNIVTDMWRTGRVGYGFPNGPAYNAATLPSERARLLVRDGLLAHHVSGVVGDFAGKWCGLGIGNPGGFGPQPYGLAILENNNVGFYNIIKETTGFNVVAGFGVDNQPNINRFIIRNYSGLNAATGKDMLIANPIGAVSLFREPAGIPSDPNISFYVDGRESQAPFRNMLIQNIGKTDVFEYGTFSALGRIGNANATAVSPIVLAEGFRAQKSRTDILGFSGVATNLQTLAGPFFPVNDAISAPVDVPTEAAELSWQDLDFPDPLKTEMDIATAEKLDKFFISMRNNVNTNPFESPNRIQVMTFQGNGRVGISTTQPVSSVGFGAPIFLTVAGDVLANGVVLSSDKRFKKEINNLTNAMDKIRQLRPTTYYFDGEKFPERHFSTGKQYGFIAQELEQVMPELAAQTNDGYYAVNYTMLIPVLTEAIKEQDEVMQEQAATIARLSAEMAEMRSQFNDIKAGQQAGTLQGYRLEQNTPNPFSQGTVIAYAVPEGTTGATLNVYDLTGRTVKSFNLTDGEGTVTLNAAGLSAGLYIYDLQVNGRQMLERKMSVAGN
jgi:Chaperone of endosialidase/Secretion system C-terminal sorting domain